MSAKTSIALIICSQRQSRKCPTVATFVRQQVQAAAASSPEIEFNTFDLLDWKLPMFDGPMPPAAFKSSSDYSDPHIRKWSEAVASQNAFVFVTPQYNWGYPAYIKNAIDHLFHEWNGKPAMMVTYGGHGGGQAAVQLRQVLMAIKMQVATTAPALLLSNFGSVEEAVKKVESGGGGSDLSAPAKEFKEAIEQAYSELKALLPAAGAAAQAVTQSQGLK